MTTCLRACFANQTESAPPRGLGNQPVEIRRVRRNKPDSDRIRRHILRQRDDCLNERSRCGLGPSSGFSDAAERAVAANDRVRGDAFLLACGLTLEFERDSIAICCQAAELAPHLEPSAELLSLLGEAANQVRTFDDQIRLIQADGCGAAISEEFKLTDFIDYASCSSASKNILHSLSDDQRAVRGGE